MTVLIYNDSVIYNDLHTRYDGSVILNIPSSKILAQLNLSSANTDVDLYTVPIDIQTDISKLVVTNIGTGGAKMSMWVRPFGAAKTDAMMVISPGVGFVPVGDRGTFSDGLTLFAGDVITIQSDTANVLNFHLFGAEIN